MTRRKTVTPQADGFDFSSLEPMMDAQDKGVRVEITDPSTGKPACAVVVAGPDTAKARGAERRALREMIADRPTGAEWGEAEEDEYSLRVLAYSVMSWDGVRWGGEELPCTTENVLRLLRRFPFIRKLCDRRASDRRNFMPS